MTDLLAAGHYYSTQATGKGKSWDLLATIRTVNASCVNANIVAAVQAHDTAKCAESTCTAAERADLKSDCVITCFYRAMFGKKTKDGVGEGLPASVLVDAFEASFKSKDPTKGGCADIDNTI